MKKPKVTLKNIKFHEGHDTMIGLNADIWIDGVKCMHVHDDAYGGCFEYHNFTYQNPKAEQIKTLIKNLEDYIAQLPEKDYEFGGRKHKMKVDMDMYINDLVEEWETEKNRKKFENQKNKLMQKAILIGVPDGKEYKYFNFKKPLSEINPLVLEGHVKDIKHKHCKDGKVILNTNLAEHGITI